MTSAATDRRRARSSEARRELIVKARDLDNDDKSIQALTVVRPTTEAGQRTQLIEVVSRLHPDADFRSFGNGGATFLAGGTSASPTTARAFPRIRHMRPRIAARASSRTLFQL